MPRPHRRTTRRPTPTRSLVVRFALWTLRLIGAAIRAVTQLLWEAFTDQFRAASQGLAGLVKKTVPWIIVGIVLLIISKNNPESAGRLFGYVVVIGLLVWGFRTLLRKMFR